MYLKEIDRVYMLRILEVTSFIKTPQIKRKLLHQHDVSLRKLVIARQSNHDRAFLKRASSSGLFVFPCALYYREHVTLIAKVSWSLSYIVAKTGSNTLPILVPYRWRTSLPLATKIILEPRPIIITISKQSFLGNMGMCQKALMLYVTFTPISQMYFLICYKTLKVKSWFYTAPRVCPRLTPVSQNLFT